MNAMKCLHCIDGTMQEESYSKAVKKGRKSFQVEGLKRFSCDACGGELITRAQFKENNRLVDDAVNRDTEQCVGTEDLRCFRVQYDLTQREASTLFGAGQSSFAKWESGQCAMSTPAALLVRCALDVPGVVLHLAALQGLALDHGANHSTETDDLPWTSVPLSQEPSEKRSLVQRLSSFSHEHGEDGFFAKALERSAQINSDEMVAFDRSTEWLAVPQSQQYAPQPRPASRLHN